MSSERLPVRLFVLVLVSLLSSTRSVGTVLAAEKGSTTANVHDVPSCGRNGLGVANNGQYVTEFGLDQNLVWKTEIDAGVSSPCIWGNHIWLTCFDASTERLATICIDRRDGQVRWRRELRADQIEEVHEVSSPANSTPATDGKRVYVYFASYGICRDVGALSMLRGVVRENTPLAV